MRYRVDELAARARVSVDTVRFYQSRDLLSPPVREGRVAWYSDDHLERLQQIRDLKDKGFTLAAIKSVLDGEVDADVVLAAELQSDDERRLSLEELAETTGVSPALLQAIEREGLLRPAQGDDGLVYTESDARAVAAGLELLEVGLPLGELLDLARAHDQAMRSVAERAVEMFVRFVRDPIHASAASEEEAAERLLEAFRRMLPAATSLVSHHFRRALLELARERIEREGIVEPNPGSTSR